MNTYHQFSNYLQENYIKTIQDALTKFIAKTKTNKVLDENYPYNINEIKITHVQFTKSEMEEVQFNIYFHVHFNQIDYSTSPNVVTEEHFILPMKGSFQLGFTPFHNVQIDEEVNHFSDQLVPIIYTNELDKYATKFLKYFCPEAIHTPMKINVNEVLEKQGLDVYFAPLDANVYAKIYFASDTVFIYENITSDNTIQTMIQKKIQPGTILINLDKTYERPKSAYRNTIIHEAVHWFFHRNYFELRHLLDSKQNCMVCYKEEDQVVQNEIIWMEWQARNLAPKILMPKKAALKKLDEISKEVEAIAREKKLTDIQKLTYIFEKFRDFFGVSSISARIRLLELGIFKMDGIKNYIDNRYVEPYTFQNKALKEKQTFCISQKQFNAIVQTNFLIQNALLNEQIVYTNSMLVLNHQTYYNPHKGTMTEYALNHAHECCFIFDIQTKKINYPCENGIQNYLYNQESMTTCDVAINQTHANLIFKMASEGNKHFEVHKLELPDDFGGTLKYHYQKAKENQLFKSYLEFEEASDVPERTIRSYMKGPFIPSRDVVIKLCLALRLSSKYFMDMLEKAEHPISCTYGENSIYFTIIFGYERQGLVKTYKGLESVGKGYLLNVSSKWVKEHIYTE